MNSKKEEEECARKRSKFVDDSQPDEMAGVLEHPYRAQ